MRLARRRWKRRQVEAVRAWMACRQEAVVRVGPLRQLGITRIHLYYLAGPPIPSQPPPLLTTMRRGNERDVSAVVPRDKLTTEATLIWIDILRGRGQAPQFVCADDGHSPAADVPRPRLGAACHLEVTSR